MARESKDLLRLAAAGDEEALERLIKLHEPSLLAFVRASAGPALRARESVRDILQDILFEFTQGLGQIEYRGEAEFRGWLYTLAERRVRDRARHFKREKRDAGREHSLQDDAVHDAILIEGYSALGGPARELRCREDIERLEAAFAELPPNDREVLSLSFFCGMSTSEIATHLALTEEAVRKRKIRAQTRLAALWGDATP